MLVKGAAGVTVFRRTVPSYTLKTEGRNYTNRVITGGTIGWRLDNLQCQISLLVVEVVIKTTSGASSAIK